MTLLTTTDTDPPMHGRLHLKEQSLDEHGAGGAAEGQHAPTSGMPCSTADQGMPQTMLGVGEVMTTPGSASIAVTASRSEGAAEGRASASHASSTIAQASCKAVDWHKCAGTDARVSVDSTASAVADSGITAGSTIAGSSLAEEEAESDLQHVTANPLYTDSTPCSPAHRTQDLEATPLIQRTFNNPLAGSRTQSPSRSCRSSTSSTGGARISGAIARLNLLGAATPDPQAACPPEHAHHHLTLASPLRLQTLATRRAEGLPAFDPADLAQHNQQGAAAAAAAAGLGLHSLVQLQPVRLDLDKADSAFTFLPDDSTPRWQDMPDSVLHYGQSSFNSEADHAPGHVLGQPPEAQHWPVQGLHHGQDLVDRQQQQQRQQGSVGTAQPHASAHESPGHHPNSNQTLHDSSSEPQLQCGPGAVVQVNDTCSTGQDAVPHGAIEPPSSPVHSGAGSVGRKRTGTTRPSRLGRPCGAADVANTVAGPPQADVAGPFQADVAGPFQADVAGPFQADVACSPQADVPGLPQADVAGVVAPQSQVEATDNVACVPAGPAAAAAAAAGGGVTDIQPVTASHHTRPFPVCDAVDARTNAAEHSQVDGSDSIPAASSAAETSLGSTAVMGVLAGHTVPAAAAAAPSTSAAHSSANADTAAGSYLHQPATAAGAAAEDLAKQPLQQPWGWSPAGEEPALPPPSSTGPATLPGGMPPVEGAPAPAPVPAPAPAPPPAPATASLPRPAAHLPPAPSEQAAAGQPASPPKTESTSHNESSLAFEHHVLRQRTMSDAGNTAEDTPPWSPQLPVPPRVADQQQQPAPSASTHVPEVTPTTPPSLATAMQPSRPDAGVPATLDGAASSDLQDGAAGANQHELFTEPANVPVAAASLPHQQRQDALEVKLPPGQVSAGCQQYFAQPLAAAVAETAAETVTAATGAAATHGASLADVHAMSGSTQPGVQPPDGLGPGSQPYPSDSIPTGAHSHGGIAAVVPHPAHVESRAQEAPGVSPVSVHHNDTTLEQLSAAAAAAAAAAPPPPQTSPVAPPLSAPSAAVTAAAGEPSSHAPHLGPPVPPAPLPAPALHILTQLAAPPQLPVLASDAAACLTTNPKHEQQQGQLASLTQTSPPAARSAACTTAVYNGGVPDRVDGPPAVATCTPAAAVDAGTPAAAAAAAAADPLAPTTPEPPRTSTVHPALHDGSEHLVYSSSAGAGDSQQSPQLPVSSTPSEPPALAPTPASAGTAAGMAAGTAAPTTKAAALAAASSATTAAAAGTQQLQRAGNPTNQLKASIPDRPSGNDNNSNYNNNNNNIPVLNTAYHRTNSAISTTSTCSFYSAAGSAFLLESFSSAGFLTPASSFTSHKYELSSHHGSTHHVTAGIPSTTSTPTKARGVVTRSSSSPRRLLGSCAGQWCATGGGARVGGVTEGPGGPSKGSGPAGGASPDHKLKPHGPGKGIISNGSCSADHKLSTHMPQGPKDLHAPGASPAATTATTAAAAAAQGSEAGSEEDCKVPKGRGCFTCFGH